MMKQKIYVVQFGTGASINLLPLAAGQLYSRLLADDVIPNQFDLPEIIFRRPRDPAEFASQLQDVSVIGFSCFLWNVTASLQAARAVRERFPNALIVLGGPSIPKDPDFSEPFIRSNPFIDVIGCGEGEEVFAALCRHHLEGRSFDDVPGIIIHDRATGQIRRTGPEKLPAMESLPSPYLDGTFDSIYSKYADEFSGIIWETNRGCPYRCAYCTWGNLPSNRIREKPMEQVRGEVEWIGRNGIRYIAMSDANFGIRQRDLDVANLLAECKRTYGVPNFISVSWVKNSHENVLKIADIFSRCGIGYRVTLSLQSLNTGCCQGGEPPEHQEERLRGDPQGLPSQAAVLLHGADPRPAAGDAGEPPGRRRGIAQRQHLRSALHLSVSAVPQHGAGLQAVPPAVRHRIGDGVEPLHQEQGIRADRGAGGDRHRHEGHAPGRLARYVRAGLLHAGAPRQPARLLHPEIPQTQVRGPHHRPDRAHAGSGDAGRLPGAPRILPQAHADGGEGPE